MNKFWGIVFGVVLGACGLMFIVAPIPGVGWWLPEGVSTHSYAVDLLFYVILFITGFFFFLTEALLVIFMLYYGGEPGAPKPVRAGGWPGPLKPLSSVLHDSHRIEMAWTFVPAVILLFIALVQIPIWAEVKYQKHMPEFGKKEGDKTIVPLPIDVSARQFEWRIRYPSHERFSKWLKGDPAHKNDFDSFHKSPQADDVHLVNELHTWKNEPTVVFLTTRDVIHSFNIPVMRVKQDALPGKVIPVWFVPTKANVDGFDDATKTYMVSNPNNVWDIPCAELCGWGHYRMIGRVYVHDTQDEFLAWLKIADGAGNVQSGSR